MLTLSEALRTKQLDAFVRQEEARGVGPIDRATSALARTLAANIGLIKFDMAFEQFEPIGLIFGKFQGGRA